MDVKKLPGGGVGFNAGGFTSRLASAARYTGLRDKYQSLAKIVKGSASAIRSGKFSSQSAMERFRSSEKDLSWDQKRDAQQILKHLEKSAAEAAEQRASHLNNSVKSEDKGFRVDRAGVLRARRAYEQMQQGGSKEMQKKTFADLQEAENKLGEKESGRFGSSSSRTGLAGNHEASTGLSRGSSAGATDEGSPYHSSASSGNSFRLR
jgi:hypothetical protein